MKNPTSLFNFDFHHDFKNRDGRIAIPSRNREKLFRPSRKKQIKIIILRFRKRKSPNRPRGIRK